MRRSALRLVPITIALALAPHAATAAESTSAGILPRSYIVVLADGIDAAGVARAHVRAFDIDVTHVYRHALDGYAAEMSSSVAGVLRRAPLVRWVERDRPVRITSTTLPTGIARVDAELSGTAAIDGLGGRVDADAAVLDTGVDLDHPDLNVIPNRGKNCVSSLLAPDDLNGHGTHVAGTIGALDDGSGVVGVAPGSRIWPVKVLSDTGTGLVSWVICGVDHVTAHASDVEVVNLSLVASGLDDGNCGNTNTDSFHKAICASVAAGVTYAAAAGNSARDAYATIPANYDEVIAVSALADFDGEPDGRGRATCRADVDDTFANFSNYGADVDLTAPGTCIRSTYFGGSYSTMSGTSMATPHVAGAVALYAATDRTATPAMIRAWLIAHGSSDWVWPSQDKDKSQEPLLNVAAI